jgi:protocatechuate 4,5-dioxygenase beta chain
MAEIIGGIGTTHIPSIGNAVDRKLQQTPQWKSFFDGYVPAQEWLARTKPDIAIVIYNDHGADLFLDKMPTFAVGAAAEYPPADEGWGVRPVPTAEGDVDFSWHTIESLIDDEFDITICQELAVDHGFLVPMNLLWPGEWPVRVLPIAINVIQHPVPTPLRCYKLGQALRRAVDSFPSDARVVVIATGGLSHQLNGERAGFMSRSFDEMFLDAIESDPMSLTRIPRQEYMDRAGAEAIEVIMWLTMRGAMNDKVRRVHRFYQMPVSLTGAGMVLFENEAQ